MIAGSAFVYILMHCPFDDYAHLDGKNLFCLYPGFYELKIVFYTGNKYCGNMFKTWLLET